MVKRCNKEEIKPNKVFHIDPKLSLFFVYSLCSFSHKKESKFWSSEYGVSLKYGFSSLSKVRIKLELNNFMKKIEEYKNNLVKIHAWRCTEGTNNTVFYNAIRSVTDDKKMIIPENIKLSLNLPDDIKSFYDQKKHSGAYERLWDFTIISLCSDIEYFLKDLFSYMFSNEKFSFGFYQRFSDVIEYLKKENFHLSSISNEIEKITECFQVRHIAIHNMGYADDMFINKTNFSINENEKFIVTQEIYRGFYDAYMEFLDNLDENIS